MNAKSKKSGVPIWTDAIYNIPTEPADQTKLYNRVETLVELYVSEDSFRESDWKYLTNWMQDKNNKINCVTFRAMTLSSNNLQYITEMLYKNKRIKTVIFYNYTVKDEKSFEDFCSLIKKFNTINRLRITINELSQYQLQQLKSSIDRSIKEVELIHEPVYIATTSDAIAEQVTKKRKFLIAMKEINFIRSMEIGWNFFNALKNSPALEYVSIQSAELNSSNLPLAADAISQNESITRVAVTTSGWDHHRHVFKKLLENDRITQVSIHASTGATPLSIKSLSQSLTRPSLTSLSITTGSVDGETFKDLFMIPNVTDFEVSGIFGTNTVPELLAPNKYIKKLHLTSISTKGFIKLSNMMSNQLTTLTLSFMRKQKQEICQLLKYSKSITDLTLIEGSGLYGNLSQAETYESIADILEGNSTLKSLTLRLILPNEKVFFEKFTAGLKKNKVLAHLETNNVTDSYDMFADALIENDTLTSLNLEGNEPMPSQVMKFKDAIAHNRSLKSFGANGINKWTEALKSLRTNNTLQTIKLTTLMGDLPDNQFFTELEKTLQTNQSLIALQLKDTPAYSNLYRVPIPNHIQKLLDRNQLAYHRNIDYVYSLITMIRLRPETFTSILPLELWLMVLKRLRIPSCRIDFSAKLLAALSYAQ